MELKLTRHAVFYKMKLHPAVLERNNLFALYIFKSFTVELFIFPRATNAVTLLELLSRNELFSRIQSSSTKSRSVCSIL